MRHGDCALRPVFLDCLTTQIYPSRFPDGRAAPFHLLDGLPEEAVVARLASGRVLAPKPSIVRGFEQGGVFYSMRLAAIICEQGALNAKTAAARRIAFMLPTLFSLAAVAIAAGAFH